MFPCIRLCREVEGQSDYTFFYNDNQIKLDKKVSVKAQNATIEQVLAQMFKNSGYTYKIVNNQIIVSKANHAEGCRKTTTAAGKESDRLCERCLGEPIIGASVVENRGSDQWYDYRFDGNFTLTVSGNEL